MHNNAVYRLFILMLLLGLYHKPAWCKKIVCTTTILYDMTRHIAPEGHTVTCLMPIGGDPHIYDPTPADAAKIEHSDIIIQNGLFLEGWLSELILTSGKGKTILTATQGISPIVSEHMHASPDPHTWMDPLLGKEMVKNIANGLINVFPEQKMEIQSKTKNYLNKLDSIHIYIQKTIASIPTKQRVLITSHDGFKYYAKQYGLKVESALGTSTEAEVQTTDIARLIETIKRAKIKAIFVETTINPKLLKQIAKDAGVIIGGSLYSDSIGDTLSPAPAYTEMLVYNTRIIAQGLLGIGEAEINPTTELSIFWIMLPISVTLFCSWILLYFYVSKLKLEKVDWKNYTISVANLNVSYDRKTVLSNINFNIESGKLYGLIGPNGAGKSTLFKSILGFIKPDTGQIKINGKDVDQVRNKIAYIPQKEDIDWTFPATVFEIVITGRLPYKSKLVGYNMLDKTKALNAIKAMGLENFKDRQIGDLSGGQQQRVFIARAMCQDAEVLFFDEPFVGVDVHTEQKIMQSIKKLKESNKTIIIIHHDLSKVKDYFDAVIMVNQVLVAYGTVEEIFTPENIKRTYSGKSAILHQTDEYIHG